MSDPLSDAGAVLGRTPSGLFILTATDGAGRETGLLASWVQQAGFEPPAFTVAVNKKRYLNDWLAASPRLAVSCVGETQKNLLGHFGRGFAPGEPAFEGLPLARTQSGLPVLADSLGWMAGEILGSMDVGDHIIYAVQITEAQSGLRLNGEKPWVHLRKSGLSY